MTTTGLGTIQEDETVAPDPPGRRDGRAWLRVVAIVVVVGLVANLLAAVLQSHLKEPQAWPTPELQHKFDRVAALARLGHANGGTGGTVLFGDSLLDAGGDPSLITTVPQPVFNASLAGETLPVISSWATRVVMPRLHPSLVVLGFTVNVLNGTRPGEPALVSSYDRSRTVQVAEGGGDWVDRADNWLRSHVALYRERSVLRDPFASAATGGGKVYDPPLSASGWNEDFRAGRLGAAQQAQAAAASEVHASLFAGFKPSDQRMRAFGALIDQLRREGARVVVVMMPVSSAVMPAVGGAPAYQAAASELLSVAGHHGAPTLDAGLWADRFFADAVHLNAAGTNRFSGWLDSRLIALTPRP